MTAIARLSIRRLVCLLAGLACPALASAEDALKFTTEDYPPYNFTENGTYKGVGYEQVVMMMQGISTSYTVEMMPWARAYALAETDPMTCVFTTAHIPEREGLFKWVEPLAVDRNIVVSRADAALRVKNIEEARSYSVGTQRDDYTQALLERNGFTKIDLAANLDLTIKKLESGRIDLMPISEKFLTKLQRDGHPLKGQFVLTEQKFAVACNKHVPDSLINQMQANLNAIIADGRQREIFVRYGMEVLN
ncbi:substrate-binding periplasmic protein [Rhizobium paknamense]|uniref:Polar amino acid transport system substrate-binding protein n=1 Tax=Rhizobium paknamense TaxID=1206817 RepID=A0ABU0IB79_9HYPH|nr:ABC transporter substrate-binding protein [Rhizobium paknamense]MDQ0454509.1 polar amino acid transport system substrate-binding protein [Rhizobium paknamense]